ncbi:hypothetical protein GJAV_G00082250 [Gymnothorax javanicus]|nr:hypothetical protein GJAV_G00082250 [Gymnothorax javanicus]
MAGWSGFSDEELRRMQQKERGSAATRGPKPAATNRSRQQLRGERALHQNTQQREVSAQLPPEQQLAKPAMQTPEQTAFKITPEESESEKSAINKLMKPVVVNHQSVPTTETTKMGKELEKQEVELREKTRLERLQQEQRIMEEKNKRKKALLAKAIAEKSKQTQAETVKLQRVQKELRALDDMVSSDIGILRGRIEEASWDYSGARKRYEKAEAEFVSAKLDLHKKAEVKEQLTEHLYAIIQENELRKARNLEELMKQLELQADEEGLELDIQVEQMLQEVEVGQVGTGVLEERPLPDSPPQRITQPDSVLQKDFPANEVPASSS